MATGYVGDVKALALKIEERLEQICKRAATPAEGLEAMGWEFELARQARLGNQARALRGLLMLAQSCSEIILTEEDAALLNC